MKPDLKYLRKRGKVYWVRLRVPPALRPTLGHHLEKSLRTNDLRTAQRARHAVLAEFHQRIDQARQTLAKADAPLDGLLGHAEHLRSLVESGEVSERDAEVALLDLLHRSTRGRPKVNGHPRITPTERDTTATALDTVAVSDGIRLSIALDAYLTEAARRVPPQTLSAKRRRLADFAAWFPGDPAVDAVTRRQAGGYVTEVLTQQGAAPKTTRDVLSDLSAFFNWAAGRGLTDSNPFTGVAASIRESTRGTAHRSRRPWSHEELLTLVRGLPADDVLGPFMTVLLYSGLRANELAELKLADVHLEGSTPHFAITEAKSTAGVRVVPVHPAILPLVGGLAKSGSDYLLPGLRAGGENGRRGHYILKRAGRLIRKLGVTDPAVWSCP